MKKVLIITLISTAVLVLIENVLGFALAIPFLPGGDAAFGFSLGGNVVAYSFPMTAPDAPNAGVGMDVIFHPVVFAIGFLVRTLIIYLMVSRKNKISLFFSDHQ